MHKQELPKISRTGLSSQAEVAVSANEHSKTTKSASKWQRATYRKPETVNSA